jgi:hypothetical protein
MDMQEINARVIEQFRSGADIDGMHRDRLLIPVVALSRLR